MGKRRKKVVTTKNTGKNSIDTVQKTLKKVNKALEGRRKWGIIFYIQIEGHPQTFELPLIASYDDLFNTLEHEIIKDYGREEFVQDALYYWCNAICNNDSITMEEFWNKHHYSVISFFFPIMLLTNGYIELELENNDDRFVYASMFIKPEEGADFRFNILKDKESFDKTILSIIGHREDIKISNRIRGGLKKL